MTTTIETFLADIRYFSALDPYNWQVDNRPLSDLEDSINTLASGLESSINSSKLNSLVSGLIHQTIVGRGKATGHVHQPSNMVWRLERSLTNGWITDDGKEVATIAVQVSPQEFTFSAPSSGQKKLITICSEYTLPNDSELPYYDETQTLETAVTGFNNLVCKVGSANFNVQTSTVALADPDIYPSWSPGQIPLFYIRIDAGDTALNKVYYINFIEEGQSILYASTVYQGQVRFANSQEVTDRSTDTVVSPSTSASISASVAIDELAKLGLGIESPTKPALVLTSGDLNSVITPAKKRYFTSGVANIPFPSGIVDVEKEPLLVFQFARSTDGVQMATRTSGDDGYSWTAWTYFAKRNGDPSQTFKVAPAVANDDAVRLEQLTSVLSNFTNTQDITTVGNHSFVVPAGINRAIFEIQAGGGGGGPSGNAYNNEEGAGGSGGASGQCLRVLVYNLIPGSTIGITVGAGGFGTTQSENGGSAYSGGNSSIVVNGYTITTQGGNPGVKGGDGDNNGSDPPHRSAGGALKPQIPVQYPFCAISCDFFHSAGEGLGQIAQGGTGGSSVRSLGGAGGAGVDGGNGVDGSNGQYGSGGGGGGGGELYGGVGGDGGDGYVKIWW